MQFNKTKVLAALAAMALSMVVQQADAATVNVSANVTTSQTWLSSNEYVLTQPIFVKDGATLTIQPGTVVRGLPPGATVKPGALIVTRGSKLVAVGTQSAPIVFTDENDNNIGASAGTAPYNQKINGVTAQWGGLIMLGNAYIATNDGGATLSPDASLDKQIEGIEDFGADSRYGGGNDDDDSGALQYVSIRYGGFVIGADNEINGLTLGAVGRGTDISHVEIFQTKDDGVEFFGSTVNTKYMLVWAVGDDGFDWDEGFRGKGQFWMVVQGVTGATDKSDKGGEFDGGDGDSSLPSSIPTIYNATFIGHGKTVDQKNTALHLRDGTGGRFFNTVVEDFGGGVALVEGAPGGSYDSADNVGVAYTTSAFYNHETADLGGNVANKLAIENSLFRNNLLDNAVGLDASSGNAGLWGASSGDENKAHYGFSPTNNGYNLLASATKNLSLTGYGSALSALTRSATGIVVGGKTYNPVVSLNPLANQTAYGDVIMTMGRVPPKDGFFTPVSFVGAMAGKNWAAGWTLASRLALLDTATTFGNYTGLVPDISKDGANNIKIGVSADMYAGVEAEWYLLVNYAGNWYHYTSGGTWAAGIAPTTVADLVTFSNFTVVPGTLANTLASGTWTFYFGVDFDPNGTLDLDSLYFDVQTLVRP
jgi:hypothetical protein